MFEFYGGTCEATLLRKEQALKRALKNGTTSSAEVAAIPAPRHKRQSKRKKSPVPHALKRSHFEPVASAEVVESSPEQSENQGAGSGPGEGERNFLDDALNVSPSHEMMLRSLRPQPNMVPKTKFLLHLLLLKLLLAPPASHLKSNIVMMSLKATKSPYFVKLITAVLQLCRAWLFPKCRLVKWLLPLVRRRFLLNKPPQLVLKFQEAFVACHVAQRRVREDLRKGDLSRKSLESALTKEIEIVKNFNLKRRI